MIEYIIPISILIASFFLTKPSFKNEIKCDSEVDAIWKIYKKWADNNKRVLNSYIFEEDAEITIVDSNIKNVKIKIAKQTSSTSILEMTASIENSDGIEIKSQSLKCSSCLEKEHFCYLVEWLINQLDNEGNQNAS